MTQHPDAAARAARSATVTTSAERARAAAVAAYADARTGPANTAHYHLATARAAAITAERYAATPEERADAAEASRWCDVAEVAVSAAVTVHRAAGGDATTEQRAAAVVAAVDAATAAYNAAHPRATAVDAGDAAAVAEHAAAAGPAPSELDAAAARAVALRHGPATATDHRARILEEQRAQRATLDALAGGDVAELQQRAERSGWDGPRAS